MVSVLLYLKQTKNNLIGNPTAKLALQREGAINTIVDYVNCPPLKTESSGALTTEIRIEAAHVIASLAYGTPETLPSLLDAAAHEAVLFGLSGLQPNDSVALKTALARALRALAIAIADGVGPALWGLGNENSEIRSEARPALDFIFQTHALDLYLPLMGDPCTQIKIAICQLLASSTRLTEHRTAVINWIPIADRMKENKGKRGWEKLDVVSANSPSRYGGWVVRNLSAMLRSRDSKLQEASLLALAALTQDNPTIAAILSKSPVDREVSCALSTAVTLSKSRHPDLQLAACFCATRIIRTSTSTHIDSRKLTLSWTLLHVLNGIIADPHEPPIVRTKACFILYALVTDDKEMCQSAVRSSSLIKLAVLIKSITPTENFQDWGDGEPETTSRLREAAMTAVAALTLFDNEIRDEVTDSSKLCLIPDISICLSHPHVGVRFAACQCVRAISRAVAVLRTSIVDTGVGLELYKIVEKPDEDRRVSAAALACICNLVNNFSPLRATLMTRGLIPRIAELVSSHDPALKLNALWAVKNLMHKSTPTEKESIMDQVGWQTLASLLHDADPEIQEQALNIMRNIASRVKEIELLFHRLGPDKIIGGLKLAMESPKEGVLCQGMFALANIANGAASHRASILSSPQILSCLRACLTHSKLEARQAAVSCVQQLAQGSPHQHKELRQAGIVSTLRHISVGNAAHSASGTSPSSGGHQMGIEEDKNVRDAARFALQLLEHDTGM